MKLLTVRTSKETLAVDVSRIDGLLLNGLYFTIFINGIATELHYESKTETEDTFDFVKHAVEGRP